MHSFFESNFLLFVPFDLQQIELKSELIFSILTKAFIMALVIIAMIYIFRVLLDKSYTIRFVHVPSSFEQSGHSGSVIANRIYYRIQLTIQRVSAIGQLKGYSTAAAEKEISVDVGGMGLPIRGFVELLGSALGINRSKKVDADFFLENKTLIMLLKISGHPAERFEQAVEDSIDEPLRALIIEAAETILKHSNDEILQSYYGLVEQVGEKQIKLARYRYDKGAPNARIEENIIAAWAWGLVLLKRFDDAEAKIVEGIARHKNRAGRIYIIWGSMLMRQGKFEEALDKFQAAIRETYKKESPARISNLYASIGNCYGKLGQIEEAKKYLNKAIEADSNSSRAYFTLGLLYLSSGNKDQFFEYLEKSLSKGFLKRNVLEDPTCAAMVEDQRMTKILTKYSSE
jgi:hypothetical protein